MLQFRDHQHYKAAESLSQSNHQVQILFVRACINMYLKLVEKCAVEATMTSQQEQGGKKKSLDGRKQFSLLLVQRLHYYFHSY